jgi:hypothetical protein
MQLSIHTCSSCDQHHQWCTKTKDQWINEKVTSPDRVGRDGGEHASRGDNDPERSCHRCYDGVPTRSMDDLTIWPGVSTSSPSWTWAVAWSSTTDGARRPQRSAPDPVLGRGRWEGPPILPPSTSARHNLPPHLDGAVCAEEVVWLDLAGARCRGGGGGCGAGVEDAAAGCLAWWGEGEGEEEERTTRHRGWQRCGGEWTMRDSGEGDAHRTGGGRGRLTGGEADAQWNTHKFMS